MHGGPILSPALIQKHGAASRLSDTAYRIIREAVLSGQIDPGTRLRLKPLAEELAASQTVVREALNRLTSEGLVVTEPYRGFRVVVLSREDLCDLYELAAVVRGLAMEIAAAHITPEQLAQMRSLLPKTFHDEVQWDVAVEANREFWWTAILATGRKYLIRIANQIQSLSTPEFFAAVDRNMTFEEVREAGMISRTWNTMVLEALEARDPQRAHQAAVGSITASLQLVLAVVDRMHARLE